MNGFFVRVDLKTAKVEVPKEKLRGRKPVFHRYRVPLSCGHVAVLPANRLWRWTGEELKPVQRVHCKACRDAQPVLPL